MPKSRGRRKPHGGKNKPTNRAPRPLHRADRLMRDARQLVSGHDPLTAELWASGWLGEAWVNAGLGEREPEHELCMQVCGRACRTPSAHGLAAVAALARVAPISEDALLTGTIDILAENQALPSWHSNPTGWAPVTAWRAMDVWESEHILFVDYDGPRPHTVMAQIYRAGGVSVDKIAVLESGAAAHWDSMHDPDEVPMPLSAQPVAEVLAELADALRSTDMTWPRNDDPDFVEHRSLAWSRCRDHLPEWPEHTRLSETERERLVGQFIAAREQGDGIPDNVTRDSESDSDSHNEVARSLAQLFLDYGEGYIIAGPLSWSPAEVMLLLTDWLPRKAVLDDEQRRHLPEVLRQWIRFALTERGLDPQWITPVVEAIDEHLDDYRAAFDDDNAWGPAKQIAAALAERGVDLTDRQAVDDAVRALNAERLAQRLLE